MTVTVRLPGIVDAYTGGERVHEVEAGTVGAALARLDDRFPGLRFRLVDEQERLREHLRLFVDGDAVPDLATRLRDGAELQILAAVSGG